ncbi:hypothetical protein BGX24_006224, partial [Mortierella sp. AD032]
MQQELGLMYYRGLEIILKDYPKVMKCFSSLYLKDLLFPCTMSVLCTTTVKVSLKIDPIALQWLLKAADGGLWPVMIEVGTMYCHGIGIPQDYDQARGYLTVQIELGKMYLMGRGVPQDYQVAVEWFIKAAKHGDMWAQHELGLAYISGGGIALDRDIAEVWFQKTAEQDMRSPKIHTTELLG